MNIVFIKKSSLLREGIVELLKRKWHNEKVYACDGTDIEKYESICEVAIIDLDLDSPDFKWIQYFYQLGKKVIVWVSDEKSQQLAHVFKLGLDGYFYKDMEERELLDALYLIESGEKYLHPVLSASLLEEYVRVNNKQPKRPVDILSNREWEVLQLLSKGYNNLDIAANLYLSDKTVKNYISSILKKLNVPDRTNAVLKAIKEEWLYIS
ncbi:Transcriptional regulatory protein DegU [Paraliobacillus sp. PM-2]|uniref:response regulator transcription factor n=1 Tax=Paraliobacillus sp. PM-2 TaxID=1462524 RepID=UPI00061CA12D|nr:response regulator transcription factor [Paraliobacillus sp. PM-2]CQR46012.1 Transcriptional regulatory protein DegU [Paraliobacillus sp. PM-2]